MIKLQRIQNKAVKFIRNNDVDNPTIEEAHLRYKLEPINVRFHRRAQKTWEKLERLEPDLVNRSLQENNDRHRRDHYWWRRIAADIENDIPEPVYVYEQ